MNVNNVDDYGWQNLLPTCSHSYVSPAIVNYVQKYQPSQILDLGCGNGALCAELKRNGFNVVGVDYDATAIELANAAYLDIRFIKHGIHNNPDELITELGLVDMVITTEVIEHLYAPSLLIKYAYKLLKPDGKLLITTPYHGYFKNLAISVFDLWDKHHTTLWEGGHIKFWSRSTITALLVNNGFRVLEFEGLGRIPWLWKSMLLVAVKSDDNI